MTFTSPTVPEFTINYPEYSQPEYAEGLQSSIDDAFALYGMQIGTLTEDKQQIAFKYAVCHMFALACWEAQGFNSAPVEMSSRNESVRFNAKSSFLNQTMCGRKLNQLLKQRQVGVYASQIPAPGCHKKRGCC